MKQSNYNQNNSIRLKKQRSFANISTANQKEFNKNLKIQF